VRAAGTVEFGCGRPGRVRVGRGRRDSGPVRVGTGRPGRLGGDPGRLWPPPRRPGREACGEKCAGFARLRRDPSPLRAAEGGAFALSLPMYGKVRTHRGMGRREGLGRDDLLPSSREMQGTSPGRAPPRGIRARPGPPFAVCRAWRYKQRTERGDLRPPPGPARDARPLPLPEGRPSHRRSQPARTAYERAGSLAVPLSPPEPRPSAAFFAFLFFGAFGFFFALFLGFFFGFFVDRRRDAR